jgi:hypothetical protein
MFVSKPGKWLYFELTPPNPFRSTMVFWESFYKTFNEYMEVYDVWCNSWPSFSGKNNLSMPRLPATDV